MVAGTSANTPLLLHGCNPPKEKKQKTPKTILSRPAQWKMKTYEKYSCQFLAILSLWQHYRWHWEMTQRFRMLRATSVAWVTNLSCSYLPGKTHALRKLTWYTIQVIWQVKSYHSAHKKSPERGSVLWNTKIFFTFYFKSARQKHMMMKCSLHLVMSSGLSTLYLLCLK